jgi:hypothetical protein
VYLPFLEGPREPSAATFRWRLGARPLDLADWIELGPDADDAIAAKPTLNAEHADTVFVALDDVEDEALEIADALVEHLRRRFPSRYGDDIALDPCLHPLDAAARLVPEDLVMMVERDGALICGGGSVCFPNRWDLRSKVGRTMSEIHQPVAQLNEQLDGAIDGFLARLGPDRSFWRLGWGVIDTGEWFSPPAAPDERPTAHASPAELYLRVERETLRRFPRTRAVLFTIRTYVTPIPVIGGDPDVAMRLADMLDAMPLDVQRYKGVADVSAALIDFLRRGASGASLDMV